MSERAVPWSTGFWLLTCAALAAVVGLELSSGMSLAPQVTAAPPPAPLPEAGPVAQGFEAPPESVFDEIALRPLFFESRRPFVPAPVDAAAEEPAPGKAVAIELIGTLVTDQGRAALLQPEGEQAVWRRAGDKIAGWNVRAIERDQVTLRLGEEVETLTLRADLDAPRKPARSAGKRKRGERDARREAAAEPAAAKPAVQASPAEQSSSQ
jgi:hypothetical protein